MTSEIHLEIGGMGGKHCATTIEQMLKNMNGVVSATVDYENGTATVVKYTDVALEDLFRAVEEAGYQAKEMSALADED